MYGFTKYMFRIDVVKSKQIPSAELAEQCELKIVLQITIQY